MNEPAKFNPVVSFLWAIADLLNGAFKKSEFQKIIPPFTVLRRLDYALEATKACMPGSAAAVMPFRRVMPKAQIFACAKSIF